MQIEEVNTQFFFEDESNNRKNLFEKAFFHARYGKVLYILQDELKELPELSQDLSLIDRHYIKMISFLYVPNIISLIERLASLADWENVPTTIVLDSLNNFANKTNIQNACGIVALLLDTARSCSGATDLPCNLYISITKDITSVTNNYCTLIKELYVST